MHIFFGHTKHINLEDFRMSKIDTGQLSLFDVIDGGKHEEISPEESQDHAISVTYVRFLSQELTTYQELFEGYDELYATTFSFSVPFIEKIMHGFARGKVIVGFDKLITPNLAELFALQEYTIDYVCNSPYLQERIQADEFHFYVPECLVNHQKLYLLKSDDGRVRTITASANFSQGAWNGSQIEGFTVCDDPECFDRYYENFETLLEFCTDRISKDAKPIKENGENAEELPINKKIVAEKSLVIHDNTSDEEQEYIFQAEKLNKKWQDRIKSINFSPSSDGKILLDCKQMNCILGKIKKEISRQKDQQAINPQFLIDYASESVSFNNNPMDLNPDPCAVKNDISCLLEYMNGFNLFTKNTYRLKQQYWKVLNYLFLSPFIAMLRYEGSRYGYEDRFFPMYMLIYGDSDAGKTGFIHFVRQMMFGKKITALNQNNFTPQHMTELKLTVKGCPVLIDELTNKYWQYAKNIVKMDVDLIQQKIIDHPIFVMLSNDVKSVIPELSKRVIVIKLNNRLDRTTAVLNAKRINTLRKTVSTFLYREYLRRMFVEIKTLVAEMQAHENDEESTWIPDIFNISTNVLIQILADMGFESPNELSTFDWFDYMGDSAIGESAFNIIYEEYRHNQHIFSANPSINELEIDFSCYDRDTSNKKLNILYDELPADYECRKVGTKAILKLDVVSKSTGLSFKKKLFWKSWRR